MGRASISINVTSQFDGKAMDAAVSKMELLAQKATMTRGQIGNGMVDAGIRVSEMGGMIERAGKKIENVGVAMTKYITTPLVAMTAATVPAALELNTSFYDLRKTLDTTEEGYQKLKQGAIEYSNVQPVSAAQILQIEALGAQLSVAESSLEGFARTVSGLSIATDMQADEAALQLSQLSNITQMNQNDFDRLGATIVDLGNHTATTESQITGMALKFASAGHQVGMTEAEILGISAALSSLGMKADAGGSALSQSINQIDLAVATSNQNLSKWATLAGKSSEEFARSWKENAAGTFIDVMNGIANSSTETSAILDDLGITQIRQSDAMRRLAGSGDLLTNTVQRANSAWQENTALQKEVDNRNESLQSQFDTLKNRWVNVAAEFGEPLAQALINVTDGFNPFLDTIHGVVDAFNDLTQPQQQAIVNFGVMAAAAGPVLQVVGKVTQGFGKMTQWVGDSARKYGVFKENLQTTDWGMIKLGQSTTNWQTRLGLANNQLVKSNGGLDAFIAKSSAYIKEKEDEARTYTEAAIKMEHYNDALTAQRQKTAELATSEKELSANRQTALNVSREKEAASKQLTEAKKKQDETNKSLRASEDELAQVQERQKNLPTEYAYALQDLENAKNRQASIDNELAQVSEKIATADVKKGVASKNASDAVSKAAAISRDATKSEEEYGRALQRAIDQKQVSIHASFEAAEADRRAKILKNEKNKAIDAEIAAEQRLKEISDFNIYSDEIIVDLQEEVAEKKLKNAEATRRVTELEEKEADTKWKLGEANDAVKQSKKDVAEANKGLAQATEDLNDKTKINTLSTKENQRVAEESHKAGEKATKAVEEGKANLDKYEEAAKKATKSQTVLGNAVTALGGAFMNMLPAIAITGAIAGLTALIAAFEDAKQRAETFQAATTGLVDAVRDAGGGFDQAAGSLGNYGVSIDDVTARIEEGKQRQANLVESINQTTDSARAEVAMLESAQNTLNKYYGQSQLTTAQQAELSAALDIVAGSLQNVAVNADGQLYNTMTGDIYDTVDALNDLIDAQQKQIEYEAQLQNYKDVYQAKVKATQDYALAQSKLQEQTQALADAEDVLNNHSQHTQEELWEAGKVVDELVHSGGLEKLKTDVKEAGELLESAGKASDLAAENLRHAAEGSEELSNEFSKLLQTDLGTFDSLQASLDQTKFSIDDFSGACQEAGLSLEALQQLDDKQIIDLGTAFDGSAQSILDALETMNVSIDDLMSSAAEKWKSGFSEGLQGAMDGLDISTESLHALANKFGITGEEAVQQFVDAIKANGGNAEAAAKEVSDAANQGLSEGADEAGEHGEEKGEAHAEGLESTAGENYDAGKEAASQGVEGAASEGSAYNDTGTENGGKYNSGLESGMEESVTTAESKAQEGADATDKSDTYSSNASKNANDYKQSLADNLDLTDVISQAFSQLADDTAMSAAAAVSQSSEFVNTFSNSLQTAPLLDGFATALSLGMSDARSKMIEEANRMGTEAMTTLASAMKNETTIQEVGKTMGTNIITGFGQAEWATAADVPMQTITEKFTGEGVSSIGQGLGDAIKTGLDTSDIPGKMDEVMTSLSTNIDAQLQSISTNALAAGLMTGSMYSTGFSVGSVGAVQAAANLTSMVAVALANGAGSALASGIATGSGYTSGLTAGLAPAPGVTTAIVAAVIAMLTAGIARARAVGVQTGQAYAQGILSTLGMAIAVANALVNAVITALRNGINQARSVGQSTGQAYADGISGKRGAAISAANGLKNAAVSAMGGGTEDARAKGAALGQAYADGLNSAAGAVAAAAARLASAGSVSVPSAGKYAGMSMGNIPKTASLPGGTGIGPVPLATIMSGTETYAKQVATVYNSNTQGAIATLSSGIDQMYANGQRMGLAYAQGIASAAGAAKSAASSAGGQPTYIINIDGARVNDDEGIREVTAQYLVRLKQLAEI